MKRTNLYYIPLLLIVIFPTMAWAQEKSSISITPPHPPHH
jgi:hypothetical protein